MKYNFMWGQYESLMHAGFQTNNIGRECFGNKIYSVFMFLDKGVLNVYYPQEGYAALYETGRPFLDVEKANEKLKWSQQRREKYWKLMKKIEKTDFSKLTNEQICEIFFEYGEILKNFFVAFRLSSAETTEGIEEEIKKILKTKMSEKEVFEAFVTLSTPSELDETMLERIAWLKIRETKNVSDEILFKHAKKYPSFFFNVYNEKEVINFLRNKLTEEFEKNEENKMRENVEKIRKKQEGIYELFNNKNLTNYSKLLQNLGLERFKLKLCWCGAEFFALPMFKEIAKRNNLALKDIFAAYDTRDIITLLQDGKKLSEEEIKARKEFYCIFFEGNEGDYTRLSGEAGRKKTLEVLKDSLPKERNELKGQPANLGIARGRAHIVLVHGIKEFEEDLLKFKKGEVLVTTMTTPSMILIAKKAVAIVTDEGGICSHAAVTSREFGIPYVVGTKDCTKVIKNGELIEVNAYKGIVKKIS